jgi:hypothetical protein
LESIMSLAAQGFWGCFWKFQCQLLIAFSSTNFIAFFHYVPCVDWKLPQRRGMESDP